MNSFPHFRFGSQCELHLSTSSKTGGYIWQLIWTLHLKIWTHFLISGLGLSVHFIWAVHLKIWVSVCTSSETGGGGISESLSGYFILQVDLVVHFIWKLDLIPVCFEWALIDIIDQWTLHLLSLAVLCRGYIWALHLKTWPNSAICFKWDLIDDIDQQRLHLLSLEVLCRGCISENVIWKYELILGFTLASQRSFCITYKRPMSWYDSFAWKMVLKRMLVCEPGEASTHSLLGLVWYIAHQVDTIALLRRWFWKVHWSVTLRKPFLFPFISKYPGRQNELLTLT